VEEYIGLSSNPWITSEIPMTQTNSKKMRGGPSTKQPQQFSVHLIFFSYALFVLILFLKQFLIHESFLVFPAGKDEGETPLCNYRGPGVLPPILTDKP
jgi:hypothetical protein